MGHLVHGLQEGRHFSAYYDGYCYQPLYVVCGNIVLWAQLRTGDTDPKEDVVAALAQIIPALRKRCPKARILVRGDSGFCREELMVFCEGRDQVHTASHSKDVRLPERCHGTQESTAFAGANDCYAPASRLRLT